MEQRAGLPLGRFLGAPVVLSGSWFVLALVVVYSFGPTVSFRLGVGNAAGYGLALVYAVLLLLSVLVHELAHAAVASAMGQRVREIVVHLMGGHTEFSGDDARPGRRALVAVSGPLANAAVAVVAHLVGPHLGDPAAVLLLDVLAYGNAALAVLNLLPGLPLDGGAVLESLVWAVSGRRSLGTVVAAWGGRVAAVGFAVLVVGVPVLRGAAPGLFTLVWALLIAFSLWQGATQALRGARLRDRAGRLRLAEHVEPAVAVPLDTDDWARVPLDPPRHVVVLAGPRTPVGLVEAGRLRALRQPGGPPPGTTADAVMTVLQPPVVLAARASGEEVLEALSSTPAAVYVVVDAGRVVGVVPAAGLVSAITGQPTGSP